METLQKPTSGPKDFFMHLLGFGALYASAISLIALWFNYINIKFPDPLNNYYYSYGYEQLRTPMAALIVLFPVFLFIARWISKQIAYNPERKELRIYKWLVYFTLFVSAVTVIVTFIRLIYNFLGGELTARFGLKVLVVLIVALAIFGYYIWHLRSDLSKYKEKGSILLWITPLVVIASIVLGFFVVGSPATARKQKMDQQRVNDLQNLQYQVINYWQINRTLPLTIYAKRSIDNPDPYDPETKEPYEYRVTGSLSFELCAEFESEDIINNNPRIAKYPPTYGVNEGWQHSVGLTCFSRTIDPMLYPKPSQ